MVELPPPRLFNPHADKHLLTQLAQIHADCIIHDKQLATFLPPLSHVRMVDYWRELSRDVEKGRTAVIIQMAPGKSPPEGIPNVLINNGQLDGGLEHA